MFDLDFILTSLGFIVPVILVIIIITQGYVKAPPDHAYIISGLRKQPRVLIGRAGIKIPFFEQLDKLADPETLIVSNTSGLSISEIAAATNRPDKVMGVHFFYPAPVMKLVELIRGIATADETYHKVKEFAIAIKKTVVDAPEYPGFIVNRVLVPMQNEAAFMVMEGCKPEDVDNAMKLGCNFPMGPLELTDFVGVDVMLATMTGLYNGFHDSKYRPCPLLETMVKAGHLGRKSGQGFYKYE